MEEKQAPVTSEAPQPYSKPVEHFAYECPGLHDKGARTLVEKRDVKTLLMSSPHIVIPMFQRAYCWDAKTTVPTFWMDTVKGSRHSIGRAIYKVMNGHLWCLDGQQRITTCLLLIASARDTILKMDDSDDKEAAVTELEAMLYLDRDASVKAARERYQKDTHSFSIGDGELLECIKLLPSYCDRRAFFELVLAGYAPGGVKLSVKTLSSCQFSTKSYFDHQFAKFHTVDEVLRRVRSAIAMTHMLVEIQTNVHVGQVFLWLQEKAMGSIAALLYNPKPGLSMHATDLARSLFLSPFMAEPLEVQERVFKECWLDPIEIPLKANPDAIDRLFATFLEVHKFPPGKLEEKLAEMIRTMPFMREKSNTDELLLYGKIVSWWEHARTGHTPEAERAQVPPMLETLAKFLNDRSESELSDLLNAKNSSAFRFKGNFQTRGISGSASQTATASAVRRKFAPKIAPPKFSEQ